MRKLFNPRFTLFSLAAVLVLGGAGYYYYSAVYVTAQAPAAPALQTAKVRTGDIAITASGAGNLVPATELDLGFRAAGVLAALNVQVGAHVEVGEVLARLDDAAAQIQVQQAELNLASAEANLAKLSSATALADAAVGLLNKQAALEDANADLRVLLNPDVAYYQDVLADAQRDYDIAASNLLLANVGAQAQAVVTAQANVNIALTKLQETVAKYGEGASQSISAQAAYQRAQDDLSATQLALTVAQANQQKTVDNAQAALVSAQNSVTYLSNYTPPSAAVALAQAKVEAAAADMAEAQALLAELRGEALPEGAISTLAAARAQIEQAKLSLASARLSLANTLLVAPLAGTVTAIKTDVGEAVTTAPILTLAALDQPLVRFYVEENDLGNVAVGYPVTVVFDAAPDVPLAGRIVRVDPALVTVDGSPAAQAWASLAPAQTAIPLLSGMSADIEIIAGQAKGALLIPVQALRELAPGSYAVFVVQSDGQLKLTPVTVGLKDFANAEILSGLQAGEVVSTGTVETK